MDDDEKIARRRLEVHRLGVFASYLLAILAASLGTGWAEVLAGGMAGYLLALVVDLVWGERTRPKSTIVWWLLGVVWAGFIAVMSTADPVEGLAFYWTLALTVGIALAFRHDLGLTPTLFIAGAVVHSVFFPGRFAAGVDVLEEAHGIWLALAVLLGIAAATFEHDRLARREGAGTPWPWTLIRLAFAGLFTLVMLSLRSNVQWGRFFALLGADLQGSSGQMFLVGVLAVAIVLAAVAFKPAKAPRGGR